MRMITVAGRLYPERPPFHGTPDNRIRRSGQVVEALKFAMLGCSEVQRRLYRQVVFALAMAENWHAEEMGEQLPAPALADLEVHSME